MNSGNMWKTNADCSNCLNRNCLIQQNFKEIGSHRFTRLKSTLVCKKGQQFIMEGAPVSGLYFIFKGKAKVLKTGIYGKEQILRIPKEGEIIGHRGFGNRQQYSVSAVALEDIVLCSFSSEVMVKLLHEVPKLTYQLMLFYSDELTNSETKVKALAQMTVREKVIDTLLFLRRKFGINFKNFIDISLSRKEIAEYSGTTDEQVIRTISSLKKEGFLFGSGKNIGIHDIEALRSEISEHNFFLDH